MRNQQGFTTVEVLVVVALLLIVATFVSQSQVDFMQKSLQGELLNEVNFVNIKMRNVLVVRSICNATFGSLNLSSNPVIPAIVDSSGNAYFRSGQTYEKSIVLTRMRVENFGPGVLASERRFDLVARYRIGAAVYVGSEIEKRMTLFARYNGATFESCFTPADIGTDDEYVKEQGIDTRVGDLAIIGTLEIKIDGAGAGGFVVAEELYQFSDRNLKNKISTLKSPLNKLHRLNGYGYLKHGDKREYGFIAQELEGWTPLVTPANNDYLAVKYYGVLPVEAESLKKINRDQKKLESEMQELESRLKLIKNEVVP